MRFDSMDLLTNTTGRCCCLSCKWFFMRWEVLTTSIWNDITLMAWFRFWIIKAIHGTVFLLVLLVSAVWMRVTSIVSTSVILWETIIKPTRFTWSHLVLTVFISWMVIETRILLFVTSCGLILGLLRCFLRFRDRCSVSEVAWSSKLVSILVIILISCYSQLTFVLSLVDAGLSVDWWERDVFLFWVERE